MQASEDMNNIVVSRPPQSIAAVSVFNLISLAHIYVPTMHAVLAADQLLVRIY